MRGGERSGSRQIPLVVLRVGAIDGVGLVVRGTVSGGGGWAGVLMDVETGSVGVAGVCGGGGGGAGAVGCVVGCGGAVTAVLVACDGSVVGGGGGGNGVGGDWLVVCGGCG